MNIRDFGMMLLGGLIGGLGAYMYAKTKYERYANEEIESIKEFYENAEAFEDDFVDENDEEGVDYEPSDEDSVNYNEIINGLNYGKYSTKVENAPKVMDIPKIYPISDEEFRNSNAEVVRTILYWIDDEEFSSIDEEPIKDGIEMIGGSEMLKEVGRYEPDVLYVRNERLKTDFEVIVTHGTLDTRVGDELYDEEDLDE